MQQFPCPFCGPRPETEFRYGGEAGNLRPAPAAEVGAARWSEYLHLAANPKGRSHEIWVHLTCGEFFVLDRDTISHEIHAATALHGDNA